MTAVVYKYNALFTVFNVQCIVGLSRKLSITRGSSLEQLEDIIVGTYPRVSLGLCGFSLARANKGRQLQPFAGSTIDELESFIGKGKLIVVPKRDLAMPSPIQQQQVYYCKAVLTCFHYSKFRGLHGCTAQHYLC